MANEDFALTARWGIYGQNDAVIPSKGRVVERAFTPGEREVMDNALPALGETTFDVYLNTREYNTLGRELTPKEVQCFVEMARRIGGILLMTATDA